MSKALSITTQILVNGSPVENLTDADILDNIRDQEAEIARLEKLTHKPEFLEKDLDARKAGIEALVKLVNERKKAAGDNAPVTRAELAEILKK